MSDSETASKSSQGSNANPPRGTTKKGPKKTSKIVDRYEYLRELTNRDCLMFTVSRLYNLDLSEGAIRRYRKILRERIKGTLVNNTDKEFVVETSFDLRRELAETDKDHVAISIEILITPVSHDDDEVPAKSKVIYSGYLIARGTVENHPMVARLPLLLTYKASQRALACVNKTIEVLFDCLISPLEFSTEEMQVFLTQCLTHSKSASTSFTLGLTLPGFNKSEVIEFNSEVRNPEALRQRLQGKRVEEASKELFAKIHHANLETQQINLDLFELSKFQAGNFVLHKSGKYHIRDAPSLADFLRKTCQMLQSKEVSSVSGLEAY